MSLVRFSNFSCRKSENFLKLFKQSSVYYSSENKSSSDDKPPSKSNEKAEKQKESEKKESPLPDDSRQRLNALLSKLSSRSNLSITKAVQTQKPLGYKKLREVQRLDKTERKPRNIADAADAVASEIGDEKVKDELLASIKGAPGEKSEFIDNVIAKLKTPTRRRKEQATDKPIVGQFSADNKPRESLFKARKPVDKSKLRSTENQEKLTAVDLYGAKPLDIFKDVGRLEEREDSLKTWSKLEQHDIRMATTYAPRNYFEKMILWTDQGKIWHFPIDNEQGLGDEKNTSFTEHIFLDEYLEPWCPKKGAIHHFMELICVGLSKNPYYTVQQKREHIEWYRDYFASKKDILDRVIEQNKTEELNKIEDGSQAKQQQ